MQLVKQTLAREPVLHKQPCYHRTGLLDLAIDRPISVLHLAKTRDGAHIIGENNG